MGFLLIMYLEDGRPQWGVGRGIGKGDTGPNILHTFPLQWGHQKMQPHRKERADEQKF